MKNIVLQTKTNPFLSKTLNDMWPVRIMSIAAMHIMWVANLASIEVVWPRIRV